MRRKEYTQEERESKMRKYLVFRSKGITDYKIAEKLNISRPTLDRWKQSDWFLDMDDFNDYDVTRTAYRSAINRLINIIQNSDEDSALEATKQIIKLSEGRDPYHHPYVKQESKKADSSLELMQFILSQRLGVDDSSEDDDDV